MRYMSGQKGRNIRINTTYCNDPRYMGIKHLLREKNYFNFKFMFGELANELDPMDMETYRASDTELYAVVTDGQTGKALAVAKANQEALAPEIADTEIAVKQAFLKLQIK